MDITLMDFEARQMQALCKCKNAARTSTQPIISTILAYKSRFQSIYLYLDRVNFI